MSYLITQVCMRIGGIRPGCNGISRNTDSKSRRYLRWLVLLLLNVLTVRLRRLNPRRLDFILDLESVLVRPLRMLLRFLKYYFLPPTVAGIERDIYPQEMPEVSPAPHSAGQTMPANLQRS